MHSMVLMSGMFMETVCHCCVILSLCLCAVHMMTVALAVSRLMQYLMAWYTRPAVHDDIMNNLYSVLAQLVVCICSCQTCM